MTEPTGSTGSAGSGEAPDEGRRVRRRPAATAKATTASSADPTAAGPTARATTAKAKAAKAAAAASAPEPIAEPAAPQPSAASPAVASPAVASPVAAPAEKPAKAVRRRSRAVATQEELPLGPAAEEVAPAPTSVSAPDASVAAAAGPATAGPATAGPAAGAPDGVAPAAPARPTRARAGTRSRRAVEPEPESEPVAPTPTPAAAEVEADRDSGAAVSAEPARLAPPPAIFFVGPAAGPVGTPAAAVPATPVAAPAGEAPGRAPRGRRATTEAGPSRRGRGRRRGEELEPELELTEVAAPEPIATVPAQLDEIGPDAIGSDEIGPDGAGLDLVDEEVGDEEFAGEGDELDAAGRRRRRRGRRGRGRGRGGLDEADEAVEVAPVAEDEAEEAEDEDEPLTRRRRRRRRGGGAEPAEVSDDGVVTVTRVRPPRAPRDEVQGVSGSTRLEAKRQRRRDGREQRRTRPAILSEAEFLARREAVDRVMVVRQTGPRGAERTQIAVLEDNVLVEHYVARQSASTMVGNVYLGKVQNVLPSMEAAFVDIGRGRNAVLYAGEVNWDATGLEGRARSIEQALKPGESVLVQVTKDPIGHKGARLTSHIALSGRHLVYVPNGHASGISRKLSDVERRRLRDILRNLVPDGAGVIVRTAAEGAAEDDLERDVKRLQAQWDDIQAKVAEGGAPTLLSSEPDLVIRVVRDLFNEDFREVVISGSDAYDQVEAYLASVSPDLVSRVRRHTGTADVFHEWRIDEQIMKALDRRVFLPSGGHLVIDRTEAMTVVDVNTGKYTGAGGNLEETVTRNNLEAAEEIVRQLRLRDLGGIVVIDFIDMVLESNRDLVLRRLTECLGRDRTKHQVTEITSLGLVQMTRKRIGQGLLEAFSETCDHCKGRGVIIQTEPVHERPTGERAAAPRAGGNVAEKVRAMASASRTTAPALIAEEADDEGPQALEAVVSEVAAAEAAASELEITGLGPEELEEAGPARRRGRRGNSRRRTRP